MRGGGEGGSLPLPLTQHINQFHLFCGLIPFEKDKSKRRHDIRALGPGVYGKGHPVQGSPFLEE